MVDAAELGRRVREERRRAGISERALAVLADKMPQARLHRIETGQRRSVSLDDAHTLARALGVSLSSLLAESPVRGRVLSAARAPEADRAEADTALLRAVDLIELEERLTRLDVPGGQQTKAQPLPLSVGSPTRQGRALAESVRHQWDLHAAPIGDLAELVEDRTGADVAIVELPRAVSGLCVRETTSGVAVLLVNVTHSMERQRFSLAHELGHLLAGDATRVDTDATSTTSAAESRAHAFARNLLMPSDDIRAWLDTYNPDAAHDGAVLDQASLANLAWHYGVSPDALLVQLKELNVLTTAQARALKGFSARQLAMKYGWFTDWRARSRAAEAARPPRRLWVRAIEAYRQGQLGISALARLSDDEPATLATILAEEGITPRRPEAVPVDIEALLSRAR